MWRLQGLDGGKERDAEDEGVTTYFIKMGNSEGVCWKHRQGMCCTRCDFSSAEETWPGLMHTTNLHSMAQPPKEVFAVAARVFLRHVEAQIWELAVFETTWGMGGGQLWMVQGKAGHITCLLVLIWVKLCKSSV